MAEESEKINFKNVDIEVSEPVEVNEIEFEENEDSSEEVDLGEFQTRGFVPDSRINPENINPFLTPDEPVTNLEQDLQDIQRQNPNQAFNQNQGAFNAPQYTSSAGGDYSTGGGSYETTREGVYPETLRPQSIGPSSGPSMPFDNSPVSGMINPSDNMAWGGRKSASWDSDEKKYMGNIDQKRKRNDL